MKKIAVVADSNCSITQQEAKEKGIFLLSMPFYINDELFFEELTLSQDEFYKRLEEDADIKTSQPSPADVLEMWDKVLEEYDELVHIPMSSGLSSTCDTAKMLAEDYDGRVKVIDNKRISVTLRRSVEDAIELANKGVPAAEIKEILESTKYDSDIYITLDTLKYLKKGGRLTASAAAIGTILNLKPVLRIKGEKLDAFAKTRGWKAAKKTMLKTIEEVINTDFADCNGPEDLWLDIAYTCSREEAEEWKAEVQEAFPGYDIFMAPLSLSVACHIGAGAKAITITKKLNA